MSEVQDIYNYRYLCKRVLINTETCFKWLQEMKMVPENPKCDICNNIMKTKIRGQNSILFFCKKTSTKHEVLKNALKNTFFENSKFGIMNILTVIYFFSINSINHEFLIRETSSAVRTSSKTIADWLNFCREVCFCWIDRMYGEEELLGGEGILVEVDECKIGKRKYNKGRLVEGTWVLVLIEINARVDTEKRQKRGVRYRLEICPDNKRDAQTMIPLVINHVKPGTIIVTDLWKSYFGLSTIGYHHYKVNHSRNFVDPIANTQIVVSSWRGLKKALKTGMKKENLSYHFAEYLYRRDVSMSNEDPFLHFMKAVKKLYLA